MVSKDITKKLESYSPKLGKSTDELVREYELTLPKAIAKYPKLSKKGQERKALDMLVNNYRRKMGGDFRYSRAIVHEGWIDGATALRDQVQEKISRVKYIVNRDGRANAILQELINENGVPLDDRPNIFGRKKNPNYGHPLVNAPPAYLRTIYGMVRRKGETTFKPFQMTFFEEAANQLTYKTGIPCEFRANPGRSAYTLYGSDTTKFYPIKDPEWDIKEEYDKSRAIIDCSELEARMTSANWDERDVRVEVDIVDINPNPINDRGDRVMSVADLSLPFEEKISVFVPSHIPMNFGQDSKVILVGRARAYKGKPSLNAYGIWPIPGEISYAEVGDLAEEDIIDVGWVEDYDDAPAEETDESIEDEIEDEDFELEEEI